MTGANIEVFKTDIVDPRLAEAIIAGLQILFPQSDINFDLEDCDRILRIEGYDFSTSKIIEAVNVLGYSCEILE